MQYKMRQICFISVRSSVVLILGTEKIIKCNARAMQERHDAPEDQSNNEKKKITIVP